VATRTIHRHGPGTELKETQGSKIRRDRAAFDALAARPAKAIAGFARHMEGNNMKSKRFFVALAVTLLLAAASGIVIYAGIPTTLVFGDAVFGVCNPDGSTSVTFSYTITSNSNDQAVVTATLDGNDLGTIQTIASGAWEGTSQKTASGSYTTTLASGQHTLEVCAAQNGYPQNPDKGDCKSQTVSVTCPVNDELCSLTQVFGEVPHNKNLCLANGHIEIQFRGNFGETADLLIEGPNNFSLPVVVDRAGDSCNYHFNWDPNGNNGGPGGYTFTVTGNNQDPPLVFTASLLCQVHGH
jgi:hypothetical protein